MSRLSKVSANKAIRKSRVRAKIVGSSARPRLSVYISNLHVSAQVIDDSVSRTIASATSVGSKQTGSLAQKATATGADLAKKMKKAKISKVVFDRNGRQYAKRLKSLLDEIKKEGIEV